MKRSKVIIGIFIALVLLVLTIILLAFTVFVVRDITVEASVSSRLIDEQKIIESAGLEIGRSIISLNKSKVKASIEKENPYIEVKGITRKFPSKVIINATVRTGIMVIRSEDGMSLAVVDSTMKVLNVISYADREKIGVTVVSGLTFRAPAEGAYSAIGATIEFTNVSCGETLKSIATAAADPSLDLSGESFLTIFREIDFVEGEGVRAFIKTNKGVTLVLDSALTSSIYNQLYMCLYYYTSDNVDVDRTRGYIVLNTDSDVIAYKWVETLD